MPARSTPAEAPIGPFLGAATRGQFLLGLIAALSCGAVALASLRHTASLAFPIDDAYIYSNYVLATSEWHPFAYNPGETSGGITSLGWYVLCTVSYWLFSPLHALLGGLGPPIARSNPELSAQAAHLYLSAYLPGVICLATAAVGVYHLAHLTLAASSRNPLFREAFCWLVGALGAAHLGLVWGAISGLELPLSTALAVWAIVLLIHDAQNARLRGSLALAALLPFGRPDLVVVALGGALWLLLRSLRGSPGSNRGYMNAVLYLGAIAIGLGAMSALYYAGWGKPLPSSFYAKVGSLRFGKRFFSAAAEVWTAGRTLPFATAAATLVAGIVQVLPAPAADGEVELEKQKAEARWSALLLLLVSASYVAALMLTLPWFGQEDRYLLPAEPFVLVLAGGLIWRLSHRLPLDSRISSKACSMPVLAGIVVVALVGADYLWATRDYVVQVRNISDAHIAPALWLAANTPPDSVVASEPIGAVRLFSGRRTVDLVGLTTAATLGTYRDWPLAWPALRSAGASYLLFYPNWFDGRTPPPWAVHLRSYHIPDNRIAGDDIIAIYRLDWALYEGP